MATSKAHYDADSTGIVLAGNNKEIIFYPRGLNIVWGNDNHYWHIPDKTDIEKPAPAELIHVSWLEVTGSYDQLQPGKKYQIKFYLSLKSDAFGWNDCQVFLMAKLGKTGKYKSTKIILNDQNTSAPSEDLNGTPFPADNFEIEVPSTTPTESDDTKLYFGLYEVWSGKEKGGLQIHKAVVSEV